MNKIFKNSIIVSGALALVFLVSPVLTNANTATSTATSTNATRIESLLKQIKALQEELAKIQAQQQDLLKSIRENLVIASDLRQGMTGDDVKALQEILAANPDLYPEGKVTGYFGPLTEKALRKFQKKYGLVEDGKVSTSTLKKLSDLVSDDEFKCGAWGKYVAPGQKKKLGRQEIDLTSCVKVPPGIFKKLNWDWKNSTSTATSTKDTTTPVIEDIDINDVEATSAEIEWDTNEKTTGSVYYSTSTPVNLSTASKKMSSSLDDEHKVDLTGLATTTKYYFVISVSDKSGNTATSTEKNFTTGSDDEDEDDADDDDDEDEDEDEDDEDNDN